MCSFTRCTLYITQTGSSGWSFSSFKMEFRTMARQCPFVSIRTKRGTKRGLFGCHMLGSSNCIQATKFMHRFFYKSTSCGKDKSEATNVAARQHTHTHSASNSCMLAYVWTPQIVLETSMKRVAQSARNLRFRAHIEMCNIFDKNYSCSSEYWRRCRMRRCESECVCVCVPVQLKLKRNFSILSRSSLKR